MDRIDELLDSANPVRPLNAPRLDARAALRTALEGAPAVDAVGQDFVGGRGNGVFGGRGARRPWVVAVAVAAMSALVVGAVVLTQLLAAWQPSPPAASPSPSVSSGVTGTDEWRTVRLSPTTGGAAGPQIQLELAPGFIIRSDVPNESYDSLSFRIVRDSAPQGVLAQIYYGKVMPQRDPQACIARPEDYVELDSVPVDLPFNALDPEATSPRFVYRVVTGPSLKASLGITSQPPGTSVDGCTEFHHVESLPGGTMLIVSDHFQFSGSAAGWLSTSTTSLTPAFASLEEARAFMATDEYLTYKRMLASVRIVQPE
ncbi:hypothetical protein [Arthrobacter sp. SO3]|uniref:hypothetical protein n=1 Tax=Arthrobacter sp. SO3 TaxID=1897057 RepID=UPI001CFF7BC7|nr:hypothetical protein [Arthrobacter sp. SO3]MCB5291002.1 hypothetical protein [Arthrobacter sp. SO3]